MKYIIFKKSNKIMEVLDYDKDVVTIKYSYDEEIGRCDKEEDAISFIHTYNNINKLILYYVKGI